MSVPLQHLLGIESMSAQQILELIALGENFKEINQRRIKKVPALRGITVVNFFVEPSTRTRISFEIAEKRLSADSINFTPSTSSLTKGETLLDTVKNLEAMSPDILVVRHSMAGVPHMIARHMKACVINAGDGAHEHPTQALLDTMTILQHKGRVDGLTVAIVGDIAHSRVARSNIFALTKLGAKVRVCAPHTMIPMQIERLNVSVHTDLGGAIRNADVVMMLRIQLERFKTPLFPSIREYSRQFGLNPRNIGFAKDDVLIMHPGPMNRGVEIHPDVADGPHAVILDQVSNGVALRMALLYLLGTGDREIERLER